MREVALCRRVEEVRAKEWCRWCQLCHMDFKTHRRWYAETMPRVKQVWHYLGHAVSTGRKDQWGERCERGGHAAVEWCSMLRRRSEMLRLFGMHWVGKWCPMGSFHC